MTELEFLKQESGLTDDELKHYETMLGDAKFKVMLSKLQAAKDTSTQAAEKAENDRLALEKQYNEVYLPEIRRTAADSIRANGRVAELEARLAKAKEYGVVLDDPATQQQQQQEQRAPGSPDPNAVTRDEFTRLRDDAGTVIATLADLQGEHFKLFGTPLTNTTEILTELRRQQQLKRDTSLQSVWEQKFNVPAKREEIRLADQKKHDDEVRDAAVREYREKHGDNPMTRVGTTSRFSTIDPAQGQQGQQPWQRPSALRRTGNQPWRQEAAGKLAQAGLTRK